jgi:cytochrome c2
VQVGKGQCPACHVLIEEQRPNRFPRLVGVMARAGERIHEERYKKFAKRYEAGEPSTGIKPHAKTAGEYLIESIYCPSCYVVEGINIGETEEMVSPMPVINGAGFGVNDYEMVAIVSYLQAADAKGDLSKVTARQDWENYFGKKLTVGTGGMEQASAASPQDLSRVGLAQEKPEEIIQKMGCYLCHTIPTVAIAQTGKIGPLLALKTIAAQRIASPEYQRAVKEGKARAKTPKDYVIESILYPSVFITPGFDDAMPKDFKQKMTLGATERLAEFLITLEEEPPKKEGSPSSPAEAKRPPKSKG